MRGMRVFLIAFAAFLLGAGAASAECITAQQVIETNLDMTVAAHLKDDQASPFITAAGAKTGVTLQEREVLVLTKTGAPTYVVLFHNGCATKAGKFHADLVDKWLHGLAAGL